MMQVDIVILGAGAAGMMAAIEAGRRGRRVLLIDHAKAAGEKIRISGGGRCNFTNLHIRPECFLSQNPRFALSALKQFTQWDFIARVDAAGIKWHEKTLGQLFCNGSSREIVSMLLRELAKSGVTIWLETEVGSIHRKGGFQIETSRGIVSAASVIVATGGKSIPKMGATGFGYRVAESFGLPLVETRPGLVPLTLAEQVLEPLKPLSGTSVEGRASLGPVGFDEAILFTHRGISGPAILQISSYWREGDTLSLDLARGVDVAQGLREARQDAGRVQLRTALARFVPEKLARHLETVSTLTGNLADQNNARLDKLAALVHGYPITPVGSEGYRTAEVTLGGVSTDALDARTMQAKDVPGLFFVGEVVDVTGWLGGYNFQWAWSSGWAAGQVA